MSKESSKEEETLELGPEERQRVDKVRTGFMGKAQRTGMSGHIYRAASSSVRLEGGYRVTSSSDLRLQRGSH